ncbi:MAG TPA: polysaccharide biosynthesis/export family protein [Planctomycetota bacterium]|nr:polysaccharide biosynthesis/export family protein [Planctomycetota bacterium]
MTTDEPDFPAWLRGMLLLMLGCLSACGTFEEKRIRELLNEKGFGARATGDATRENYLGGLDTVQFLVPPEALLIPGAERLAALSVAQPVSIDGTIFVPYVGPVYALGKTEVELATLVRQQLRTVFKPDIDLQARIVTSNKRFYAIGEVLRKGPILMTPDLTLIDAIFLTGWTNLANLGRIYVIRPDAEHPLVVDINLREILTSGNTTANIAIRERDILWVPPTFLGLIARLLQRLLEPVALAVRTMLGFAEINYAYDVLTGQANYYGGYYRF